MSDTTIEEVIGLGAVLMREAESSESSQTKSDLRTRKEKQKQRKNARKRYRVKTEKKCRRRIQEDLLAQGKKKNKNRGEILKKLKYHL